MKSKSKEAADSWKSLRNRAKQLNSTISSAISAGSAADGSAVTGGDATVLVTRADIAAIQVRRPGPARTRCPLAGRAAVRRASSAGLNAREVHAARCAPSQCPDS
jgi:hypothetical protein